MPQAGFLGKEAAIPLSLKCSYNFFPFSLSVTVVYTLGRMSLEQWGSWSEGLLSMLRNSLPRLSLLPRSCSLAWPGHDFSGLNMYTAWEDGSSRLKEQSCLCACLSFASVPCPLKILPKFPEGQLYKPSGQDFPCVLSNLCFTGKTLRPLLLPHISLSARRKCPTD